MSVLRAYDPSEPSECDEHGIPLDWERCRTCAGMGALTRSATYTDTYTSIMRDDAAQVGDVPASPEVAREAAARCKVCGGHGSLKAAALAELLRPIPRTVAADAQFDLPHPKTGTIVRWSIEKMAVRGSRLALTLRHGADRWTIKPDDLPAREPRCEGCGHPMSDGASAFQEEALISLTRGDEPLGEDWSPCGEGCRHGVPVRVRPAAMAGVGGWNHHRVGDWGADIATRYEQPMAVEASWRGVDVRTIEGPHDLRVEKLAVLCLRCWAERS